MKRLRPYSYAAFILSAVAATLGITGVICTGLEFLPAMTVMMAGSAEFAGVGMLLLIISYIPEWIEWYKGSDL